VVQLLTKELVRAGHEVTVGVLSLPGWAGEEYVESLRQEDLSAESIPVTRRGYLAERRDARAWLGRVSPDVLHTHGYRPLVVDSPVARNLGIGTVTTFHGFLGNTLRERLYESLEVRAARRVGRAVAVSRGIAARLERGGLDSGRICVIPNALPEEDLPMDGRMARRALGIPDGRFVLGWVGRLSREKGPDVAVRAHALLGPGRPLLAVVGDGADGRELRALSGRLGTTNEVVWLGALPSAHRFFRAFDGLMLSSRSEGTPMVLLEAARLGVPIVATRVGEVAEITGEDGALLVDPERPELLAAAIQSLMSSPDLAACRAARVHHRVVTHYSGVTWAERHVDVYAAAKLIGGARTSARRERCG
jgi:glycosyltransferase involved in cell wall biosynthesis